MRSVNPGAVTPRAPRRLLWGALMVLAVAGGARAEPRLYVDGVAPLAWRDGTVLRGALYDQLRDLARRTGHSGKIALMPVARELAQLKSGPVGLGTMPRDSEVESSYLWLCRLLDEQIVLTARVDSTADLASLEAMRDLRVGVILGSPSERLAQRLGLRQVESTALPDHTARKLALGRIDAWLVAWGIARFQFRALGEAIPAMRRGPMLQPVPMYLVASRDADPAMVAQWKSACLAMQRDGSQARILRRYRYEPPGPESLK